MKKIIILLIACIGFTAINTDAQTKKKRKHHTMKVTNTATPTHTTTMRRHRTLKPVTVVGSNKSLNDGTTGVMGKEPIRDNAKGKYRNMNTNTGVDLPPSDGSTK